MIKKANRPKAKALTNKKPKIINKKVNLYKVNNAKNGLKNRLITAVNNDRLTANSINSRPKLLLTIKINRLAYNGLINNYGYNDNTANYINSLANDKIINYIAIENKQKITALTSFLANNGLIVNRLKQAKSRLVVNLKEKYKVNQKIIGKQAVKLYNIAVNNGYCYNDNGKINFNGVNKIKSYNKAKAVKLLTGLIG